MPTLEDAIVLAVKAHRDQKDKAEAPYILHPLRVMLPMATGTEMIVALLHDVVEDGGITIDDLQKAGYSEEILIAIDCLTRRDGEEYDQFIDRVKGNPLAIKVKIADLKDNSNLKRIAEPKENDYKRLEKYRRALEELMKIEI
jgi:hypothetical protein